MRLVAKHPLGVPVHEEAGEKGGLRRVPDGTEAILKGEAANGWLHVAFADGSEGFVTKRYLASSSKGADGAVGQPDAAGSGERERTCAAARQVAATRSKSEARIATFNVRWFPDGQPGKKAPAGGGTDLGFLACTIAATGAEVVLVQEFKRGARAEASLSEVLEDLGKLTHGKWEARFDDCPIETAQHVGVLFDRTRARPLGDAETKAELNPLGGACTGSLRPGLAQRFALSTGQNVEVVSVHLKSGDDARSHALRATSLTKLAGMTETPGFARIFGGDLNTMGCSDCRVAVSATEERSQAARAANAAHLRLVDPEGGCSHYYRGHAGLLDGFLVPPGLAAKVEMAGACAELACAPDRSNAGSSNAAGSDALDRVSDHCPLVLSAAAP